MKIEITEIVKNLEIWTEEIKKKPVWGDSERGEKSDWSFWEYWNSIEVLNRRTKRMNP